MIMVDLREQIFTFNRWQVDSNFRFATSDRPRNLYFLLRDEYIDKDISLSISGLRRVGKTTIIYQLINFLLDSKIDSNHIFYFQFTEDFINLGKILDIYFSKFSDLESVSDRFCIFLDELQYVKNWQVILKKYVDKNPKLKFIITGSASIYFRENIKESLAGRILDFKLDPLSFTELIRLKDNYKVTKSFDNIVFGENDKNLSYKKLEEERFPFKNDLGSYLRSGEFPALIPYLDDLVYCRKYLIDGIIDKILHKDIRLFEVEKEEEISELFKICSSNMSQMINLKNVASETGLSYPTIKKYLSVLKKTYLLESVTNKLRSIRAQFKSLDKVFLPSINLALSVLSIEDPLKPPFIDFRGHIVENFIYNSIKNLGEINYYNVSGKEVDLVLEKGSKIIPFEIKSSVNIRKTDTNHLIYFMNKNKIKEGYLIYGGEFRRFEIEGKIIYLLPYWIF